MDGSAVSLVAGPAPARDGLPSILRPNNQPLRRVETRWRSLPSSLRLLYAEADFRILGSGRTRRVVGPTPTRDRTAKDSQIREIVMLANMFDHVKQRLTAFRLSCEKAHRITTVERERIRQTAIVIKEELALIEARLASIDTDITPTLRMRE